MQWSFAEGDPALGLTLAARAGQFCTCTGISARVADGSIWPSSADQRPHPRTVRSRSTGRDTWAAEQGDDAVELLEASRRCALDAGALKIAAQATSHLSVFLPVDRRDEDGGARRGGGGPRTRLRESMQILGIALNNLGEVFREIGDDRRALGAYEESYTVRREIGDKSLIALSLINLSEMAAAAGDLDRARSPSSQALDYAEQLSDRRHVSFALADLGWIELADGRVRESIPRFVQALRLSRELGMSQESVIILHGLAGVSAAQGDAIRGAWLEAAAQRHERELDERIGHAPSLADQRIHTRYLERARRLQGSEAWDHAWAEGAAASLDEAIAYASSIG